jgi:hypothetical protein
VRKTIRELLGCCAVLAAIAAWSSCALNPQPEPPIVAGVGAGGAQAGGTGGAQAGGAGAFVGASGAGGIWTPGGTGGSVGTGGVPIVADGAAAPVLDANAAQDEDAGADAGGGADSEAAAPTTDGRGEVMTEAGND